MHKVWLDVQPLLEHSLLQFDSRVTLEEIFDKVLNGTFYLVVVLMDKRITGVFITSVERYSNKKVFFINMAVGENIERWKDEIVAFMIKGAKALDCDMIEWRGRPGFMKVFKDICKVKHVSMIYELEKENG